MFPSKYLIALGIDKASLPASVAMGTQTDYSMYFSEVTLNTDIGQPLSVYAGFTDNLNGDTYGLLGHMGFLNRFRLRSDPQTRVFELEEIGNV
jgi:hypothetical protein